VSNGTKELTMIRIIVVDDHLLFRMSLQAAIETHHPDIVVCGEAGSGEELFHTLADTPADVVLLDVNLPDMRGDDIARRLRSDYPSVKILAVSGDNTAETIAAMLEAGIDGFVGKLRANTSELVQAIRTVAGGIEYFGRDISAIIFDLYVAKKKTIDVTPEFTDREREIIILCRDGLIGKEIADRLNISINTVNFHKKNIYSKLGINNTTEMIQYALKNGIIRMN